MVENQVRPWEVLDGRVLDVISRVRREDFVAAEHRQLAFADLCLPLGHGEVMMKPVVEGRSEEHTSELQSLMRISYAVFCLKKKQTVDTTHIVSHYNIIH